MPKQESVKRHPLTWAVYHKKRKKQRPATSPIGKRAGTLAVFPRNNLGSVQMLVCRFTLLAGTPASINTREPSLLHKKRRNSYHFSGFADVSTPYTVSTSPIITSILMAS